MGAARVVLVVIAAVLTLLGTYLFALFPFFTGVGSGLGFAMNLPMILTATPDPDVAIVFYLMLVVFIAWLAAGVLQLIGIRSRIVGIIFSLVPLTIGIMFVLLVYTDVLGLMSAVFFFMTVGEQIGGVFPVYIELADMGLGVYFLLAGGVLGIIGSSLPRD